MNPWRSLPTVLAGIALVAGAQRAVLLELYTSEGCDSCPPADRRLSQFKNQPETAGRLVPLAFHVDYWDRLGWVDRFASPRHTQRQYVMAELARSSLVYTPQFLRNGRDWRSAGSPLDGQAPTRPGASIVLELGAPGVGMLAVSGEISVMNGTGEAWLALYENNLESRVRAGENRGRTLRHDYVVRRLIGPLAPDREGRLALRQQIPLETEWKRADLGVVAFVQDRINVKQQDGSLVISSAASQSVAPPWGGDGGGGGGPVCCSGGHQGAGVSSFGVLATVLHES